MVTHLGGEGERRLEINDYAGLGSQQPAAAAFLSLYLFSLLGLPVTAGFLGKFYIFNAALKSHLVWLAVLLAINTVIGAYYYLRVIVVMYMREPQKEWAAAPIPGSGAHRSRNALPRSVPQLRDGVCDAIGGFAALVELASVLHAQPSVQRQRRSASVSLRQTFIAGENKGPDARGTGQASASREGTSLASLDQKTGRNACSTSPSGK